MNTKIKARLALILKALFAVLVGAVTFWSFMVPDAPKFQQPALARIFFFHFPCPMLATFLLVLGSWFGWKYLQTGDRHWDVRSESALELGYIFSLLTMATGIIFSQVQWGTWWQWDPRQTSFLLVLLIYAAYFALRGALSDEHKRAANSAGYAIAALLPALFLIFVFPRLPQVQSFHPTDSIMKGNIKGPYAQAVISVLVLVTILSAWLYRLRVRAGLLELQSELMDGRLEIDRGAAAPTGVVRPVSLPVESGEASQDR